MRLFKIVITVIFSLVIVQNGICQNEIYIPFKSGEKWGMADTNRTIIIQPIYERQPSRYGSVFKIKNNNKYGVCDSTEKIILNIKYDRIFLSDNTIETHLDSDLVCFNFKGDTLEQCNPTDRVNKESNSRAISRSKKKRQRKKANEERFKNRQKYLKIKNDFLKPYTIPIPDSLRNIEPPEHKTMFKFFSIKQGGFYQLGIKKINRTPSFKLEIDTFSQKYLRIKSINLTRGCQVHDSIASYIENSFFQNWALLTSKDSLQGLITSTNRISIPMEYDSINPKYVALYDEVALFLVNKKNKWGVVSYKNDPFIPLEYEEILFDDKKIKSRLAIKPDQEIIVKKNGFWGIITIMNEVLVPFEYERIEKTGTTFNPSYVLVKNGKYGLYHSKLKKYIKPFSEYKFEKITSIPQFNDYLLISIYDKKSKFLGYADLKVFYYFNQ